ncbi:hypothetical protein COP2_025785 [Malus domestica]
MMPSISTILLNFKQNEKEMTTNLDLAEEEREKVITCIAAYQHQLISNYNKGKNSEVSARRPVLRKTFITACREG